MKQALSEAFVRYGMSVAVTHGEKKTQTKAFLQPVKRENGEEPFSVTPLGAVSDECWRWNRWIGGKAPASAADDFFRVSPQKRKGRCDC